MTLTDRVREFLAMFSWWRLIAAASFVSYLAVVSYAQAAEPLPKHGPAIKSDVHPKESLPPHLQNKEDLRNFREEFNIPTPKFDLKTPEQAPAQLQQLFEPKKHEEEGGRGLLGSHFEGLGPHREEEEIPHPHHPPCKNLVEEEKWECEHPGWPQLPELLRKP